MASTDAPQIVIAQGLTVVREACYLEDPGLSTSDGLEFTEATLRFQDAFDGERGDVKHGSGGELPPMQKGGRTAQVRIVGELKGKGSATYTDPLTEFPLTHVLMGCALSGSINSGNIVFNPVRPDNSASFRLGFYTASALYVVKGNRGSVRFRASAPGRGFFEYNGQGVLEQSYPVQQTLPAITYTNQSTKPPTLFGANATLGSFTPVFDSYEVSVNNDITPRLDGNNATGHAGFILTNRSVRWRFPSESVLLGSYNPYSISLSGTTNALAWSQGQTAGDKFDFSLPQASVDTPNFRDSGGRLIWDLQGGGRISSGNDEFTFTVDG